MDYHHIRNRVFEPLRHRYTRDESILYALSVGLGTDPLDERQLRFVCEPDQLCDLPTLAQSALLYRRCGDRNPLHADPEVARRAGFDRPILHGLCTWGVAAHALLRSACDYDPSRLRGLHARFSAPVFPGETLRVRIWDEGPQLRFDTESVERGITVLGHGVADIDRTTTQRQPT